MKDDKQLNHEKNILDSLSPAIRDFLNSMPMLSINDAHHQRIKWDVKRIKKDDEGIGSLDHISW